MHDFYPVILPTSGAARGVGGVGAGAAGGAVGRSSRPLGLVVVRDDVDGLHLRLLLALPTLDLPLDILYDLLRIRTEL